MIQHLPNRPGVTVDYLARKTYRRTTACLHGDAKRSSPLPLAKDLSSQTAHTLEKWSFGRRAMVGLVATMPAVGLPSQQAEAFLDGRLSDRLERRQLKNNIFNVPPGEMVYPAWMEGTWDVTCEFTGYQFPSRVPKEKITANANIPGFQKLSLVYLPDVGKSPSTYQLRFSPRPSDSKVVEDRAYNLRSVIEGYLGPGLIDNVECSSKEPNRTTVTLKSLATRNAERIELFTNSRETDTRNSDNAHIAAECIRQVTLGYSNEYGVARMLVTDYQNVWTFVPTPNDSNSISGELVTAGYLQPSEPEYFNVTTNPVVLFSHRMKLTRA
mmetsp:Transcript_38639/g.74071  ORF Transcript_38639/g.74071 Transcript_38639/m.74071 type:complete len:326 (+) Transcript_38639:79-1056(+)